MTINRICQAFAKAFLGAARLALTFLLLAGQPLSALAQTVAFINPGKEQEAYWLSASRSMEAAAKSLGMRLEIKYAQREFPRALEIAREIAARPKETIPDYVIVANEYAAGPELIRILAPRTRVFVAFSGVPAEASTEIGQPRERIANWIGSLEPRAEEAGYQVARTLLDRARSAGLKAPDGKIHVLAISGNRSTTTSAERSKGMRRAIDEARDAVLDQEVHVNFDRKRAEEAADELFIRYPQARVIWAASDQMAFGAMAAAERRGLVPGRGVLFGGINTSREALEAVRNGRLSALSGGHFILGAWALVMVHDHHRGRDFAAAEGVALSSSMFVQLTPRMAEIFMQRFGEDRFDSVDFRQFSKAHNSGLKRYDFNFRQLLN